MLSTLLKSHHSLHSLNTEAFSSQHFRLRPLAINSIIEQCATQTRFNKSNKNVSFKRRHQLLKEINVTISWHMGGKKPLAICMEFYVAIDSIP